MSFVFDSLDNQSPYIHTEQDYDDDVVMDGYLKYKYKQEEQRENLIKNYIKDKNTTVDNILNYNYQRFMNGQLSLAIISLIMFNYNLIND